VIQLQEIFDIAIGRTPPRKEFEWFTEAKDDNFVWASIADMGNCGMFIADSSEYLTSSAIERFKFKIVKKGSVLLSFKLTVGRIAIADVEMVTNEAIAQLYNKDDRYREYLYCYLKQFDFNKLGSTSSIATAVNSTTIREMPFVLPKDKALSDFHAITYPMFEKARITEAESRALAELRDALLPKLMSGELDVSEVAV
jgi:type I restriction enzyme S subunit